MNSVAILLRSFAGIAKDYSRSTSHHDPMCGICPGLLFGVRNPGFQEGEGEKEGEIVVMLVIGWERGSRYTMFYDASSTLLLVFCSSFPRGLPE